MKTVEFRNRAIVVGDSLMQNTLSLAARAALSNMPVLITGPSGTGKELIARFIHEKSARSSNAFVSVNCAALPEGLMEAELFGYERGAFTGAIAQRIGRFERASGGTLLLDEVSEMPVHLQAKLLRVLQEGEIDRLGGSHPVPIRTRIIATTNVDPLELIRREAFRADLFYRLNVIRIDCQPLVGRLEAIDCLSERFLLKAGQDSGCEVKRLSDKAKEKLRDHSWPGNVRELQNAIERAALLSDHPVIGPEHLDLRSMSVGSGEDPTDLGQLEQRAILSTLDKTSGNRSEAARRLGISVRTLRNKLKEFGT